MRRQNIAGLVSLTLVLGALFGCNDVALPIIETDVGVPDASLTDASKSDGLIIPPGPGAVLNTTSEIPIGGVSVAASSNSLVAVWYADVAGAMMLRTAEFKGGQWQPPTSVADIAERPTEPFSRIVHAAAGYLAIYHVGEVGSQGSKLYGVPLNNVGAQKDPPFIISNDVSGPRKLFMSVDDEDYFIARTREVLGQQMVEYGWNLYNMPLTNPADVNPVGSCCYNPPEYITTVSRPDQSFFWAADGNNGSMFMREQFGGGYGATYTATEIAYVPSPVNAAYGGGDLLLLWNAPSTPGGSDRALRAETVSGEAATLYQPRVAPTTIATIGAIDGDTEAVYCGGTFSISYLVSTGGSGHRLAYRELHPVNGTVSEETVIDEAPAIATHGLACLTDKLHVVWTEGLTGSNAVVIRSKAF